MSSDTSSTPTPPRVIERHTDVAVIGGSAAGLAAALQLVRQCRSVIVVDSGEPRHAPSEHVHGYLGSNGSRPSDLIARATEEVRSYGGEVLSGRVAGASRGDGGRFRLELTGGHHIVARRLLVATGLRDRLPDIDGLAEHWGRDVIHCPFCHGFEIRGQRIVQLLTERAALHSIDLWRHLTDHLTVIVGDDLADDDALAHHEPRGLTVERATATAVVASSTGRVAGVRLTDGRIVQADAIVVTPRVEARVEALAGLGLTSRPHPSGAGDHLATDEFGRTDIAGIYAAGNVADPIQQVLHAAANGSRVASVIALDLATDDTAGTPEVTARRSGNETDWDHRYSGDRMWSGNPNGSLVAEVESMPAGRALDIGAGEGGDAVWLAERGWQVTASDVSSRALDRVHAEAIRRGIDVTCAHIDANALSAFEAGAFDLVSAQYASIPRTPDDRAVHNMMSAVAPGGTLLVVSHDLEPVRAPIDTANTSKPFDPDAYVRVDDVVRVLRTDPDWEIEVHETRPRPAGAASHHHVDDVVLRARRRGVDPASHG